MQANSSHRKDCSNLRLSRLNSCLFVQRDSLEKIFEKPRLLMQSNNLKQNSDISQLLKRVNLEEIRYPSHYKRNNNKQRCYDIILTYRHFIFILTSYCGKLNI